MKLDSGEISLEFPKVPQNHMKDDTRNESILSTEARRGKNASQVETDKARVLLAAALVSSAGMALVLLLTTAAVIA